ncbi:MAG TPA: glycosyltransferase family 1 protein [Anaerolineae bacterium]|nr:glycosyltransferase family 1 protein [Anaerolineae bacterium]
MKTFHPGLIGFDTTPLEGRHHSGVGQYTRQLLAALVARGDRWRYALLAGRPLNGRLPPGTLGQIGTRLPNRTLWMQLALPRTLAQLQPELCHFTNSIAPLVLPCPFVVTLHDMSLFLCTDTQPAKSLLAVRTILPRIARQASAIITVSHSARQDILQVLHAPPEKVHVVYEAAAPEFHVIQDTPELDRVQRKYGLHDPFILCVGTIQPRKNLGRLVEAFAQVRRQGRREQLVLAGQFGWKYAGLLQQIEELGVSDAVRLTGYVPDADLPALYNLARVVAFPSLYEGFGLPVIEGMACGVPVITSNRSSMAELGSGAALLVDSMQPEALADGLSRLLSDATLRAELREAGLARAAEFSWARAAEETAKVYERVAADRSATLIARQPQTR